MKKREKKSNPGPGEPGLRKCLGSCEKLFESTDAGNRLCRKCARLVNRAYPTKSVSPGICSGDAPDRF